VRGQHDPLPRLKRLWAGATASLVAVYCAQETIEAALTGAHGSWTSAALGDGGWVALPLALVVGLAIAGLSRGAAAATRRTTRRPLTAIAIRPAATAVLPPWAPHPTHAPSRNLAARGPPLASV
jgi:hypothetical protein